MKENQSIQSLVRQAEENYNHGFIQKSAFVTFNPKSDIDKIEAYINSKFTSAFINGMVSNQVFMVIVAAVCPFVSK